MNNYHYIVGGLPELFDRWTLAGISSEELVSDILEQCSSSDKALLGMLCSGLRGESLDRDFYEKALKSRSRFIREYFLFDLRVRNAKVKYLNSALGKPESQGTINLKDEDYIPSSYVPEMEFPQAERLKEIFEGTSLLEREKALDDLYREKIDDLSTFEVFSLDGIMAFIAKLNIIDRWHKLDRERGREMFRRLVSEVTATYTLQKTQCAPQEKL